MAFFTIQDDVIFEEEIKKSRFITYLRHTEGLAEARAFWAEIRAKHPHARHHCWATVASLPQNSQAYGFSDDGEPSGTAGKPMLNYLQGSGWGEISAVVVRYYGGIQLGTGGLVRAYGNGVAQALKQAIPICKVYRDFYRLQCDYDQLNSVQNLFSQWDIVQTSQTFGVNVQLDIGVNPQEFERFHSMLIERFAGKLTLEKIEK